MKPILTTPAADAQLLEIELWWLTNRDKNPDFFRDEVENAFALIATMHHVGQPWDHPQVKNVRRKLLKTGHHIYYVNEPDHIRILAVWGGPRATGPDLGEAPF